MQQRFGFSKGMRQSISPNKTEPDTYYEALNKRVVVDNKSGTSALTDEPGSKLMLTIPPTLPSYSIKVIKGSVANGGTIDITTELGSFSIPYNSNDDLITVYDKIRTNSTIQSNVAAGFLHHGIKGDVIRITMLNGSVGTLVAGGYMSRVSATVLVPALEDMEIIATSIIRKWLIIFTRNGVNGQIWKVRYNLDNDIPIIPAVNLVYSGKMYPDNKGKYEIFDVVGRWDNENLVKIYWSNMVDSLLHLDIATKDSLSLPYNLLSIVPNVKLTTPQPTRFNYGGLYYAGMVQYGYQLYNIDGAETVISPLSGLIHLTDSNDHAGNNMGYKGLENGEMAGKSIKVDIKNIDTNFNMIKVIAVYYTSEEGEPEVNVVYEGRVPIGRDLSIVDAGDTVLSVYTPGQLNSIGSRSFSPKLLTSKDGYLIAGNYKDYYFDIDKSVAGPWDARAYRYTSGPTGFARIRYEGSSTDDIVTQDFKIGTNPVPDDHDCHLDKNAQFIHKYRVNSNILGGSGPNIEYEFFTRPLLLDDSSYPVQPVVKLAGDRQQWGTRDTVDFVEEGFIDNTSYTDYSSPVNQSEMVGFQRDEVYRFGIVFFDEKGRQSFVKWIADIKMPSQEEVDGKPVYNRNQTGIFNMEKNTYEPFFKDTASESIYANTLGVKFIVKTGSMDSRWSYSIVRVRREEVDKTIVAQGTVFNGEFGPNQSLIMPARVHDLNLIDYNNLRDLNNKAKGSMFFYSPEFNFGKSFTRFKGDLLRFKTKFTTTAYETDSNDTTFFNVDEYKLSYPKKDSLVKTISDSIYVGVSNNTVYSVKVGTENLRFQNYLVTSDGDLKAICYAGSTMIVGFVDKDDISYIEEGIEKFVENLAIVNYERVFNVQYGGASYNVKRNNQYIRAGKIKQCGVASTPDSHSHVFGGDTFIGMYNFLPTMKDKESNFAQGDSEYKRRLKNKTVMYLPLETTINLNLRGGLHPGNDDFTARELKLQETVKDGFKAWPESDDSWGAYPSYLTDIYQYNYVYSKQPTGKSFTGKPLNFREIVLNDCVATNSEHYIPGEYVDSWTKFLFNNKIQVNSANGPLSKLHIFRNQLMFWQDKAFGVFSFNDRKVLKEPNGAELILGTGSILEYYRYITEKSGTAFTRSVVDSGAAMYWMDDTNYKMMMFAGEQEQSISDVSGVAPLFKRQEMIKPLDIIGVFDKTTRRVLHSFIKQEDIYIPPPPDPKFVDIELLVNPDTEQIKYGALYNWYAATDVRNICADGWEVPTSEDAIALRTYLGGGPLAGGKLKEAGVLHWLSPNVDATNEVGFNARGSGSRAFTDGAFPFGDVAFMYQFNMWTIGEGKTIYNCTNDSSYFESNNYVGGEAEGSSMRLIKTSTTLTHGQTGIYTGNDGKVYRTICIGTQEWTAANSAETKFRNGDWITGFDGGVYTPISDVDWAAKTTEAMCYYDDLVTNAIEVTIGGTVTGGGTFNLQTQITIKAMSVPEYSFINWTEAGSAVSTDAEYSFTVTQARTLVANFLKKWVIAVSSSPVGGGTTSGGGAFIDGASVTVVATPATGYDFTKWMEGATQASTSASYNFSAAADRALVANFTLKSYAIAASVAPTSSGSITGAGNYNHGASVSLVATPATGYTFVNWTEGGSAVGTNATLSFTASAARTLVANFTTSTYAIAASVSPAGSGTITGTGTFNHGATVTLVATPTVE